MAKAIVGSRSLCFEAPPELNCGKAWGELTDPISKRRNVR